MTDAPDLDDIARRLEAIEDYGIGDDFEPLESAADEFIHFAEHPELRVNLGLPVFDAQMRGIAPGEMCVVVGYAHSGKTVLATQFLRTNRHVPIVLFTPDETRPAVLAKLTAAETGVAATELERRILNDDHEARELLVGTARKFHQLAVYDDSVTIHKMERMLEQAEQAFGADVRAVVFDYAELLNEGGDTKSKLDALKRFGKDNQVAMIVLHQTSRSAGAGGAKLDIDSGSYGGEQHATFLLTVRRKINYWRARIDALDEKIAHASNPDVIDKHRSEILRILNVEIPASAGTTQIGLVKNKRPPMNLVDERDFRLDSDTGTLVLLEPGETPRPEEPDEASGSPLELIRSMEKEQ